jgi:hypothetical protein
VNELGLKEMDMGIVDWMHTTAAERELVHDCEAFLTGKYAQHLASTHRIVPPWAWLNTIAHGSVDEVLTLGSGDSQSELRFAVGLWDQAEAYLARELMHQCDRQTLSQLQHSVLVPLELELAGRPATRMEPRDFVTKVLTAVRRSRARP